MSTNSNIGILYKNGEIEVVDCYFDGYLNHNGVLLYDNITTLEQVKDLLAKGDISFIDYNEKKGFFAEHYIDRGGDLENNRAKIYSDEVFYKHDLKNSRNIEYVYLFSEEKNKWLYLKNNGNFMLSSLEKALRENKIIEHETSYFEMLVINKNDYKKLYNFLYKHDSITNFVSNYMKVFYDGDSKNKVLFFDELFGIGKSIEKFLIEEKIPYSIVYHNQNETQKRGELDCPDSLYLDILKEARSICPLFEERILTESSELDNEDEKSFRPF